MAARKLSSGVSKYMADLGGRSFGQLVVLRFVGRNTRRHAVWEARCACGNLVLVAAPQLSIGDTRSCGCLQRATLVNRNKRSEKTLAGTKIREYRSWISAKRRCLEPTDKDYPRYGALGVTFSSDWADSFEAFYQHVGDRPPGTTLDRIDNGKGYVPGNVKWSTPKEQAINRRTTRWFDLNGARVTTEDAAKHFGVTPCAIFKRFRDRGTLDGYNPRRPRKGQSEESATG